MKQILQMAAVAKGLEIDLEISPDVDRLTIDAAKLKQVVYHYVSNAIKFTRHGRSVIRALAEGADCFRLEVEDTAIGIRSDEIHKLFAEFRQLDASTRKRHQGTGLGLALTKNIVEAQGGRVGANSVVGKGSTF